MDFRFDSFPGENENENFLQFEKGQRREKAAVMMMMMISCISLLFCVCMYYYVEQIAAGCKRAGFRLWRGCWVHSVKGK